MKNTAKVFLSRDLLNRLKTPGMPFTKSLCAFLQEAPPIGKPVPLYNRTKPITIYTGLEVLKYYSTANGYSDLDTAYDIDGFELRPLDFKNPVILSNAPIPWFSAFYKSSAIKQDLHILTPKDYTPSDTPGGVNIVYYPPMFKPRPTAGQLARFCDGLLNSSEPTSRNL